MKQLLIVGSFACFTLVSIAQTSETRYYKNMSLDEEVPQEKAKYAKTVVTDADGTVTTERRNLKKNVVESREILKGEEPVGIWVYLTARGPAEKDYDFEMIYSDDDCPLDEKIKNYLADDLSLQYEAPKLSSGEQFYEFIGKNLSYPAMARRKSIEGKVFVAFEITKDGVVGNIRVIKGVHISLDKEAVRILRKLRLSSPPKINGEPQTVCIRTAISFRLT